MKSPLYSSHGRLNGQNKTRTADCGLRTADCGLRTADPDCRPGIKRGLGIVLLYFVSYLICSPRYISSLHFGPQPCVLYLVHVLYPVRSPGPLSVNFTLTDN